MVDHFLEHCLAATVNAHANVAAHRVTLADLILRIGALSIGYIDFLGVPLSEGVLAFLVLDLLGDNGGGSTQIVFKSDAILTDVRSFLRVVASRGDKVDTSSLEGCEAGVAHGSLRVADSCITALLLKRYLLSGTMSKS